MKIEKIKPIPKYIEKQIIKKYEQSNFSEHYYSYLTKNDGELVEILVATKLYKGDVYIKQVAVHGINSEEAFIKDVDAFEKSEILENSKIDEEIKKTGVVVYEK